MLSNSEGSAASNLSPPALLANAKEALRTARYDRALEAVLHCEDWPEPLNEEGALVRVEVLTRRDPVSALAELARTSALFVSVRGKFGYQIASAKAYGNARNFDSATAMLTDAGALASKLGDQAVALLAYHRGRLKWLLREFEPDCADINQALELSGSDLKVRTLLARSWLHAGREDFEKQIADLILALDTAEEFPSECDVSFVALALQSLVRVAFETGNRHGMAKSEAAYERIAWTPDIQVERFAATRALAWDAFLQGHSARAQWLLKDSKEIAPTPAWKVLAHLDRAYVARMNLNEIWANEELISAHRLARQVAWSETRGEERSALMTLAILFAETDMAQAQRYVSMYIGLGSESISPTIAHDRRAYALERYASGRVHQVLGNEELAQKCFEEAYTILDAVKHHYRAALCAWGLSEVTGDANWHNLALKHAAHFPKSPVYERIADAAPEPAQRDPFAGMTSLQREIALALCHGMDTTELSERFGRTPAAISKQVDAVYAAIGVGSRNELREELKRRGAFL